MTFTKERRIRDHCSFVSSLLFSRFLPLCDAQRDERSDSKPPNRLRCVVAFFGGIFVFFFWSLSKPYLYAPSCLFFNHFCFYLLFVKCSDKVARDVFLFHHPKRRERERERDSESSHYRTRTHAHQQQRHFFVSVNLLLSYNNAQRERKREKTRD